MAKTAFVMAGIPAVNNGMYHRLRFSVGDPAAFVEWTENGSKRALILRDIEMQRARQKARADEVYCPADFTPPNGLSGDRETATAQALAQFLKQNGFEQVIADRSLPMIFAHHIQEVGLSLTCDTEWGIVERRTKDEQEIDWLREAQAMTEKAMQMACETVCKATVGANGQLLHQGEPLTSERMRALIDVFLLEQGYVNPHSSIVAGGPIGADCHDRGTGVLLTGQPVIIDIFPQNSATHYWGDCTRTAVNGDISPQLVKMHAAVVAAKAAATKVVRPGVTGQVVHEATQATMQEHGYDVVRPKGDLDVECAMTHGTGHGIGLDVHEPPLLDIGGPELVLGDALTIEPGLYDPKVGGVRVEDMVIVTENGCVNLNSLQEGLAW